MAASVERLHQRVREWAAVVAAQAQASVALATRATNRLSSLLKPQAKVVAGHGGGESDELSEMAAAERMVVTAVVAVAAASASTQVLRGTYEKAPSMSGSS